MSVFNYKILLVTFVLWEKLLNKFTVKMWPKHVCFSAIIYQKRIGTSSCITVLYNLLYILFHITGLLWCFMFSRDLNELFIKKKGIRRHMILWSCLSSLCCFCDRQSFLINMLLKFHLVYCSLMMIWSLFLESFSHYCFRILILNVNVIEIYGHIH